MPANKGERAKRPFHWLVNSVHVQVTGINVGCSMKEVMGGILFFTLKKPLIAHLSLRIVQKSPRRADLSPPVGTYLSPSFFLHLPLKAGCFNLAALTRDRLEFHLLPESHEDVLSLLRLRKT